MTFVLKLPHRPRSAVMTMSSVAPVSAPGRRAEQRMRRLIDARRDAGQHAPGFARERPRRHHALLRAAQLRRGDHLHRLRNLLRRLHGANAPAHVNQ